jgi:hypothetical protein
MPVPHKVSKSSKPRKDIISPEMWKIINYLSETGQLKEFLHRAHELEDVGVGSTRPDSRSIAVIAGGKNTGDRVVAHELTHLLSGQESRVDRMSKMIAKSSHPSYVGGVVYPKHWKEGKVGDRNVGAGPRSGRVSGFIKKSAKRRTNEVLQSIPKNESWSGLERDERVYFFDPHEEGTAYYMSSPYVNSPSQQERAKEFGMYLLQHNVPMDIVEPAVLRLGQLEKTMNRYSGGSAELADLREELGIR